MPSRQASPSQSGSIGEATLTRAAEQVTDHARRLAQLELELELARLELKQKATALGVGIGMLVTTALLGFFALAFLLAAGAAGLATFLPAWAALLIVAGGLLLVAGVLAATGITRVKKGAPPVPELALREAKLTREALKNGAG